MTLNKLRKIMSTPEMNTKLYDNSIHHKFQLENNN